MKRSDPLLDMIGIGIGPANLSLAALLPLEARAKTRFFDLKPGFSWHPGMLFQEATLQVSYLKDLVTLVDPTNPLSFLAFLKAKKRLYRFVTARFSGIKRKEFDQYFQWAAASLDNLQFETKVEAVHFRENCFEVHHNSGVSYAKNLSIGTGLSPNIPDFAQPFLGKQVFHAINYLLKIPQMSGKKVTVIGGGQSGAEVIRRLIADHDALPQQINWVTRRGNFFPIDDSPFVNEFFFPPYSEYFFNLPGPQKKEINKVNLLASDGISMDLLEMIYRELYEIECLEGRGKICRFFPEHAVFAMKSQGEQLHLSCQDSGLSKVGNLQSDVVILATGFAYKIPGFFSPLLDHLDQKEGKFSLNRDFSIPWNGPQGHKVFLLNGCRHTRGVADPNLSLLSYRSAMVVNSLLGRQVYDLEGESAALEWPAPVPAQSFSSSNGASLSAQDFHFKTN